MSRKSASPSDVQNLEVINAGMFRPESLSSRQHRWLIALLCFVTALRIFFFSATFPFFNNVDEALHLDLILKYSQNQWPSLGTELLNDETYRSLFLFGTPEYLKRAEDRPGGRFGLPRYSWPSDIREQRLRRWIVSKKYANMEEYSPPLYYLLAGKWLSLGKMMGLRNAGLLYWTRFMNIPLYIALIILACAIGRRLPYRDHAMAFGAPLLVAFMPQDVFFSLNPDVLAPIFSGIAFLLIIIIASGRQCNWRHYMLLGISISAALLTKLANLPLLLMTIAFLAVKDIPRIRAGISGRSVGCAAAFSLSLGLPAAVWAIRNFLTIGDWTGTCHKIAFLSWKYKSLSDILPHPIFSFSGMAFFLHTLLSRFWRGEIVWGLKPLSPGFMDYFYSISTIVLLLTACFYLMRMRGSSAEKTIVWVSLAGILSALGYMAALSMAFDFGACPYPSTAKPFFTSGRLILCVMFPIFFCYTWAIDRIVTTHMRYTRGIFVIIVVCVVMTLCSMSFLSKPLNSAYNFFHIPIGELSY